MPFTVTAHMALPMYILGLLTIDLTFDIGGLHPSQTVAYYAGFRGANMLAQCILFAGLGVGFLPYFRGITQPNLIDMICFAVLLGGLGVFGGYLIPLEEELKGYVTNPTASRPIAILSNIRLTHLGLAAAVLTTVYLQLTKKQGPVVQTATKKTK